MELDARHNIRWKASIVSDDRESEIMEVGSEWFADLDDARAWARARLADELPPEGQDESLLYVAYVDEGRVVDEGDAFEPDYVFECKVAGHSEVVR